MKCVVGKNVLLVECFDCGKVGSGWVCKVMVLVLILFEFDEMMVCYVSYEILVEIICYWFIELMVILYELFWWLVFNVFCGNIDDYVCNYVVFWNGDLFMLMLVYDICL